MCFGRSAIGREAEKVPAIGRNGNGRSVPDAFFQGAESEVNGISIARQTPFAP
jgi:hypothetical protein